jgi:recombination protein RecT
LNGFEKTVYQPIAEIEKHAKKYSQTYKLGFGTWKDDFHSMAKKTVIKMLLSKYGILSVEMQTAMTVDQSIIRNPDTLEVSYVDNETEDVIIVDDLRKLYEMKKESVKPDDQLHIERILKEEEVKSYAKVQKTLMAL